MASPELTARIDALRVEVAALIDNAMRRDA